jgi:hypothetical protein
LLSRKQKTRKKQEKAEVHAFVGVAHHFDEALLKDVNQPA